jgi:hypothetical protein
MLLPDSGSPQTERRVQPMFMKSRVFSNLALFIMVMAFDSWLGRLPNRSDGPARIAALRFNPVHFEPTGFAPLHFAGAWKVEVEDARFGGVSALALDKGQLIAITDSGSLIRFPKPGGGNRAIVRDLPDGPAIGRFKVNRDSEALVRDPAGRGWWVAFEQWHQLWLFDLAFERPLARVVFGWGRWGDNQGIEAMAVDRGGLVLFPEAAREWVELQGGRQRSRGLTSRYGYVSDAVRLPDGRLLLVTRKMALAGFTNRLVTVEGKSDSTQFRSVARLDLGPLDNVEAIAAEPRPGGITRLWLMTDNDFRSGRRTLLVALDFPPRA